MLSETLGQRGSRGRTSLRLSLGKGGGGGGRHGSSAGRAGQGSTRSETGLGRGAGSGSGRVGLGGLDGGRALTLASSRLSSLGLLGLLLLGMRLRGAPSSSSSSSRIVVVVEESSLGISHLGLTSVGLLLGILLRLTGLLLLSLLLGLLLLLLQCLSLTGSLLIRPLLAHDGKDLLSRLERHVSDHGREAFASLLLGIRGKRVIGPCHELPELFAGREQSGDMGGNVAVVAVVVSTGPVCCGAAAVGCRCGVLHLLSLGDLLQGSLLDVGAVRRRGSSIGIGIRRIGIGVGRGIRTVVVVVSIIACLVGLGCADGLQIDKHLAKHVHLLLRQAVLMHGLQHGREDTRIVLHHGSQVLDVHV